MDLSQAPLFTRKLASAIGTRSRAATARAAGVKEQDLHNYLRGRVPKPAEAVKLARALSADPLWLCDDSDTRLEPQAPKQPTLADVSDAEVMAEVHRRYTAALARWEELLSGVETWPWREIATELLDHDPSTAPGESIAQVIATLPIIPALERIHVAALCVPNREGERKRVTLAIRTHRLVERNEFVSQLIAYAGLLRLCASAPDRIGEANAMRKYVAERLKTLRAPGEADAPPPDHG